MGVFTFIFFIELKILNLDLNSRVPSFLIQVDMKVSRCLTWLLIYTFELQIINTCLLIALVLNTLKLKIQLQTHSCG